MEKKDETTARTRIEEIRDLPPQLTLSEEELRMIAGGRAWTNASTCIDKPEDGNIDAD